MSWSPCEAILWINADRSVRGWLRYPAITESAQLQERITDKCIYMLSTLSHSNYNCSSQLSVSASKWTLTFYCLYLCLGGRIRVSKRQHPRLPRHSRSECGQHSYWFPHRCYQQTGKMCATYWWTGTLNNQYPGCTASLLPRMPKLPSPFALHLGNNKEIWPQNYALTLNKDMIDEFLEICGFLKAGKPPLKWNVQKFMFTCQKLQASIIIVCHWHQTSSQEQSKRLFVLIVKPWMQKPHWPPWFNTGTFQ